MGWVKLSDDFARHPKVRSVSDRALRLLLESWCYCAEFETDGLIDPHILPSFTRKKASELVDARLWIQQGKGYSVHDWLTYNLSKEKSDELREKAKARMARVRANNPANNERTNGGTSEPEPDPLEGRVPRRPKKGRGVTPDYKLKDELERRRD